MCRGSIFYNIRIAMTRSTIQDVPPAICKKIFIHQYANILENSHNKKTILVANKIMSMEIQHRQEGNNGSFFAQMNGNTVANMTYKLEDPSIMVIDHTEVDPSLRGKKVAMELVNKAVGFAIEKNYKINPVCLYVRSVFKRHPDKYKDIIYNR